MNGQLNQRRGTPRVEVVNFIFVADNTPFHVLFPLFSGAKVGKKEVECDPALRAI